MSDYMINVIGALLYLLLAPLLGGLLSGLDRKISARMQRRVGRLCCSLFMTSESSGTSSP